MTDQDIDDYNMIVGTLGREVAKEFVDLKLSCANARKLMLAKYICPPGYEVVAIADQ
jgi:hypothetical protein